MKLDLSAKIEFRRVQSAHITGMLHVEKSRNVKIPLSENAEEYARDGSISNLPSSVILHMTNVSTYVMLLAHNMSCSSSPNVKNQNQWRCSHASK